MEIKELKCRNCGSPIECVVGSRHLKCKACGSEYLLQCNNSLTQIQFNNGILFNAYIPDCWNYTVFCDEKSVSKNEATAYGIKANYQGTDMLFFPRAFYADYGSTKHSIGVPSFINSYMYQSIDDYVVQRIKEIYNDLSCVVEIKRVENNIFKTVEQKIRNDVARCLQNYELITGKYSFVVKTNGQIRRGYFATALYGKIGGAKNTNSNDGTVKKKKGFVQFIKDGGVMGSLSRGEGFFGNGTASLSSMNMSGLGIGLPDGYVYDMGFKKHDWGRAFDVILSTPDERIDLYSQIFDDFAINVNYGPMYYELQQAELNNIARINMEGAMQRQRNAMAAQQQLSRTLNETTNIVNSGYWERQATYDRVYNNVSEGIRGVNSYTDTYGRKVEADVRYDHVYQNGSDYVASDNNLNLGPDWVELNRNK